MLQSCDKQKVETDTSFLNVFNNCFCIYLQLGSHPSSADLEQHTMTRKQSEPNWYGNNAFYNYEEEVEKEKSVFSKGLRQYSTKSEPVKRKEPLSEKSSSSGVDVSSQLGAEGTADDCVQRL